VGEGFRNVITHVGAAEETVMCEACADIVFFGIVLHDFQSPFRVLSNARRMLKPAGRLVDLDWKKEPMGFGPPLRIRFSEKQATRLLEENGFKVQSLDISAPYHYVIVASPVVRRR
jgi:ubiquinone/menaquinone biosynthesis C-methylase UbiE